MHDAATAGAAPPRAYRVRLRVGALPPCAPFASRGTWPALTPAGGGPTVPPRPSFRSLSLVFVVVPPTTDFQARVARRRCSAGPATVRAPPDTLAAARGAPPPTDGAFSVQAAAHQRRWPASPSPLTSRTSQAVAVAGATPSVFRRGGVPPLPPPRRPPPSPSRAAGGRSPPRRTRGRRVSTAGLPPQPRRGARRRPPGHPTSTAVARPTDCRDATPTADACRPTHATQSPSPPRRHQ